MNTKEINLQKVLVSQKENVKQVVTICTGHEIIEKKKTEVYEYTKGFLVKVTNTNSSYNVTVQLYETDEKGNITKSYEEGSEAEATTYTYSNNKNPIAQVFPKSYRVTMPFFGNDYMEATSKRTREDWEAMHNSTDPSISINATYTSTNELTITDNKIVKATTTMYKNDVKDDDESYFVEYFY